MATSQGADTAEFVHGNVQEPPRPFSALVQVDLGGSSHPGKVRSNNEDHFYIGCFGRSLQTLFTNLPSGTVPARMDEVGYALAVADGIGGGAAGEVASQLAIRSYLNLALHTPDWILRPNEESLCDEVMRRARERFETINQALADRSAADPALAGFGTTMTLACSVGADLFVAHLGDTRAYLFHDGILRQLTRDHTLAQELADQGEISPLEAVTHRLKHVVTQALSDQPVAIRPEVQKVTLADGDALLLCSDGLTDMVDDASIARILAAGKSAQTTCQELIDQALAAGGHDNVTVALARYRFP